MADLRKILDDRTVDAIVIATPDHWHAPAAILACQAGKHVYVEKPCSHNIVEGRRMIEAARRSGRVMQVGTQIRSTKVFPGRHRPGPRRGRRQGADRQDLDQPQAARTSATASRRRRRPAWTTTCGSARRR